MIWLALSTALMAAPEATPPLPQGVRCQDFRRSGNGTWAPVRPVQVGGMTVTPVMSFSPGVSFGSVDLAAVLNARCGARQGR